MASRSTMDAWRSARRVGEDVLRLGDGSHRTVLECMASTATASGTLSDVGVLAPIQVVVQARRPSITERTSTWTRLRASQATLMAELAGGRPAFLRRVLVAVPGDGDGDSDGTSGLRIRTDVVFARLDGLGLDPVRLSGRDLDEVALAEQVYEGRCEVHVGGRLARTLIVTRLPELHRFDCLEALDVDHDLSVHVGPAHRTGCLEVAAYATLWADTRDALDAATERAEASLAAHGIRTRRPHLQAEPALIAGMPLGIDVVGGGRVLAREQLSIGEVEGAGHQLLYGVDPGTRHPIMVDRGALADHNAVVIGDPSARRRVLTLELIHSRLAGHHVDVVGSAAPYEHALAALDGRLVTPVALAPFSVPDTVPGALDARIETLFAVVDLVAGGVTPDARPAVVDAIEFCFAAHGYTRDGADVALDPPTLGEVTSAMLRRSAGASASTRSKLTALADRLQRYVDGEGSRLFEHRSVREVRHRFSLHNLDRLPDQDRAPAALLSLDQLVRQLPDDGRRLLVVDDVDALLRGATAQLLAELMATASGRGVRMTVATDDVAGLLGGPLRDGALNAGLVVLLRQTAAAIEALAEAFRLTPAEQSWLLQAPSDEGLLIAQGRRLAFRAIASDEEEQLITGGTR